MGSGSSWGVASAPHLPARASAGKAVAFPQNYGGAGVYLYELVADQIRDRMSKGYQKARKTVASDPKGRRSLYGNPKVGGPENLLDQDRALNTVIKKISKRKTINLTDVGHELRALKSCWSVQAGPKKGTAWTAKQISVFSKRFRK